MAETIPTKLIDSLNHQSHNEFVQTMYFYLEEFFPGTHDYFEKDQITETIELGIEKAHSYEIYGKNDICSYVCLMFTFLGSHFDVDPLYPWARNVLMTPKPTSAPTLTATEKVALLWKKQQGLNQSLFHTNSQYLTRLFQTLRSQKLLEPFGDSQASLQTRINKRLAAYYPEKYQIIGSENIEGLINEGIELCNTYHIQQDHEICWYVSLMFIFGSRFDIDPKYPALSHLQQKKTIKSGELIKELNSMVRHYLKSKIKSIRQLNIQQKEIA